MTRTRVKICGLTRREDARTAVALGADALGFVFVPASKRHVSVPDAADIAAALPPFVARVGLFLDAPVVDVLTALHAMPDLVPQFHGRESAEYCESFDRPYLKAIGVAEGLPERAALDAFERAAGFLLDSNAPGALGGTGHAFDWSTLGMDLGKPLILAGGLDAGNVGKAVREVAPYALDVSSGVESAKGIKDDAAMRAFMAAVAAADEHSAGLRADAHGNTMNTGTKG